MSRISLFLAAMVWSGILAGHAGAACSPSYTIQAGDTLSKIARTQLGSVFEYQRVYDANREAIGSDPNQIAVGTTLTIPCAAGAVGDVNWSVMPNPEALSILMQETSVQILDIRSKKAVGKGVIPGSISIPYGEWRGPKANPGAPPPPERIAEIIGESGLRLEAPIIIVNTKNTPMGAGRAAVVYWILKSAGASQLAILRGGFARWSKDGLPVAEAVANPRPYSAKVDFSSKWRADELVVYGIATGQTPGLLLDARPHNMFEKLNNLGEALASTLPGAHNAPAPSLLSVLSGEVQVEDGVDEVISYFKEHNADGTDGPVVTFCHTGELAALNWFYASELARLDNIQLYPESVKGWTQQGGLLFVGDK